MTSFDRDAPAFPIVEGALPAIALGLTKREYYIGQALAGMCANAIDHDGVPWLEYGMSAALSAEGVCRQLEAEAAPIPEEGSA